MSAWTYLGRFGGSIAMVVALTSTASFAWAQDKSAEPTRAATGATLREVAFQLDPNLDQRKLAEQILRNDEPQRFSGVMHDDAKRNAEIDKKLAELKAQTSWAKSRPIVTLQVSAQVFLVDDELRTSLPLNWGLLTFETPWSVDNATSPPAYTMQVLNVELERQWALSPDMARRARARLATLGVLMGHFDVDFEVAKITQNNFVLAAIREVRWFEDAQRLKPVGTVRESRKLGALLRAHPLSEGLTLDLVPEHSFALANERILEIPLFATGHWKNCKPLPRERGHKVMLCEQQTDYFGQFSNYATYKIVGGRIAEIKVFGSGKKATTEQVRAVWNVHSTEIGQSRVTDPSKSMRWEQGRATLSFTPEVLIRGATDTPIMWAAATGYLQFKQNDPSTAVRP